MAPTDRLRRALELHRDDLSPSLPFWPPLAKLMDAEHCTAIGDELRRAGTGWEVKAATADLHTQLPAASGLYMFVWRPTFALQRASEGKPQTFAWVLYVGRTGAGRSGNTIKSRYKHGYARHVGGDPEALWEKHEPDRREERLGRYLRVQPLEFWWTEINEADRIEMLERRLIALLSPPLNTQGVTLITGRRAAAFKEQ